MRQPSLHLQSMPAVLWLLLLACVLPELIFIGADLGLWGTIRWRPDGYAYGAFWQGLLSGWLPNYPSQPYVMFISYAFLHAGFWHLAVNMVVLIFLGQQVIARIGSTRFTLLYMLSILGGAAGFALLTSTFQPMVGASGALFGVIAFHFLSTSLDRHTGQHQTFSACLGPIAIMALLNAGSYLLASGHLAWETHLGGTITGLLFATLPQLRTGK